MHFSHYDDPHEAWTALMCIENTHNKCGGKVLPLEWIREVQFIKIFFACNKYTKYSNVLSSGNV